MGFSAKEMWTSIRSKHALFILALAITLLVQLVLLSNAICGDENAHLSAARHIGQGEVIYRDFFDHHVPLPYFIMGAVFSVAGPQIIAAKLVMVAFNMLSAAFMFLIVKRLRGDGWAFAATLFFAVNIVPKGAAHFYVDVMVSTFALGALYFLLEVLLSKKGTLHALLSGLFLGMGLLCKQQVALAALFVLAFLFYYAWIRLRGVERNKKSIRPKHILALILGIAAPGALVLAYFASVDALGDAIYYILFYNLTEMPDIASGPPAPTTLKYIYEYLQIAPVIIAPILFLLAFRKMDRNTKITSFLALGFMASLATIMYPLWRNYHMISALNFSFILLTLCLPTLFWEVVRMDWKRLRPAVIHDKKVFALLATFLLVFLGAYGASLAKDTVHEATYQPREGLVETASYIQAHTSSKDRILTMPNLPLGTEIHFRAERDLPGELAYFSIWRLSPEFQQELVDSCIDENVRYVVWWSGNDVDLELAAPLIHDFVFGWGNFTQVASFGDFDIYQRA